MWAGGGESAGSHVIYFGQGPSDGTDQTGRNGTKKVWSKTRCITLDWFRHCGIDERNTNPEPTKKHERWGNMVSEGNEKKIYFLVKMMVKKLMTQVAERGLILFSCCFVAGVSYRTKGFPMRYGDMWHVFDVWHFGSLMVQIWLLIGFKVGGRCLMFARGEICGWWVKVTLDQNWLVRHCF